MPQKIYQVDAFTKERFKGNPAAVCLLDAAASPAWMQSVALEMNLSETAFLYPTPDGYNLRWFTPAVEVDLCGHATLASAHVLFESGALPTDSIARFHTRSGLLTAKIDAGLIEMDFPTDPAEPRDEPSLGLLEALGVDPLYIGRSKVNYLVEVSSESEVRNMKPDFTKLARLGLLGCIVTSRSGSAEYDFISRFFAPSAGINEDPVTGSAHCCLAPYWSAKLNKMKLVGYQASLRGGVVRVKLAGDRVMIGGNAVTVMVGELL
jgi:PhzF family phenazine biosynthesis protein